MKHDLCVHEDLERKLLYVEIPRAGCSSIKYELFFKPKFGKESTLKDIHEKVGYKWTKSLREYRDFFKFSVIRDPFERFMSMFYGPIRGDTGEKGWYCKNIGIEDWPIEYFSDPNTFIHYIDKDILNRNHHTALQTYLLPADLSELDYIGHIEDMKGVQAKLSEKTGEIILFPQINKTNRNYYRHPVNMERFYEIFLEDYKAFEPFYKPQKEFAYSLGDVAFINKIDTNKHTTTMKILKDSTQIPIRENILSRLMTEKLQSQKSENKQAHIDRIIIFAMTKGLFDDLPDEIIDVLRDKPFQSKFVEFLTHERQNIMEELKRIAEKSILLDDLDHLKANFSQAAIDFMKSQ